MPLRVLLSLFLELLPPADAEFSLGMTQERGHRGPEEATPTLLHGDLHRANISFIVGKVFLFVWEFAAAGPPACDLQWHAFLTYWAYTPDDGKEPWERDRLRGLYLTELENAVGNPIDRAEFQKTRDLAWLRIMSSLGFCFADADLDDAAERAAVSRRIAAAIQECRRILGG